jgi:hypothetical protein
VGRGGDTHDLRISPTSQGLVWGMASMKAEGANADTKILAFFEADTWSSPLHFAAHLQSLFSQNSFVS